MTVDQLIQQKLAKPFKVTDEVVQNYRDRWSELPEGEFDVKIGDKVEMIHNPGIGSILFRREDGSTFTMCGYCGPYLQRIVN